MQKGWNKVSESLDSNTNERIMAEKFIKPGREITLNLHKISGMWFSSTEVTMNPALQWDIVEESVTFVSEIVEAGELYFIVRTAIDGQYWYNICA